MAHARPGRITVDMRAAVAFALVGLACSAEPQSPVHVGPPPFEDDPPAATTTSTTTPTAPTMTAPARAEAGAPAAATDDAARPASDAPPVAMPDAGTRPAADVIVGPCHTAGGELCDDFESGRLDTALWSARHSSGTLAVEAGHAHSGMYALHARPMPGTMADVSIHERVTFPARDNHFYLRAFFFLAPDLPTGNVHQRLIAVTGKNSAGASVTTEVGIGAKKEFIGNYLVATSAGWAEYPKSSKTLVPINRWFCVEMESDGRGPLVTRISVDGTELTDIRESAGTLAPPAFSGVGLGSMQAHTIPILSDVWIDDVRVSASPIGCDR
jgi:hypothetical protein